MDAPSPLNVQFETNKGEENENDKDIINASLPFNDETYALSLKILNNSSIKFILTSPKYNLLIFDNEFSLTNFQMLNRNFKIYENISEIGNDLISYINQKQIKIFEIKDDEVILKLELFSKKDNIVDISLKKKIIDEKQTIKSIIEELDNKNKQIKDLSNKINEIQKRHINENTELKQEIINKDKKIAELEKKLEKLVILVQTNQDKALIKKIDNLEKITKKLNLKYITKETKKFVPKIPINDICLFPESGYFIESTGPTIYDKNFNLFKTFTEIGSCNHLLLIKENLIALSQENTLLVLKINNLEEKNYQIETLTDLHEYPINTIVKGSKENEEIITCDKKGNILFFKIIIKDNYININYINSINPPINSSVATYLFSINNILIVANDKLYFYENFHSESSKGSSPPVYNTKATGSNAFAVIDKSSNNLIVAVGSDKKTVLIEIKNIFEIKKLKDIKISSDITQHDALCLYQEEFLIIGLRSGNIYIFNLINNYELMKTINNAHIFKDKYKCSINGIIELSNGSFASYGEDGIIKIW